MLPLLAIPVLHSSGAWIASTTTGGYLAGTLSGTWLGAFILGNSTLLGSLGVVSAAGIGTSLMGGLSAAGTTITAGTGAALSAVGLGGLASKLGIAPVATFLGVTPVGWAVIGAVGSLSGGYLYLKYRGQMKSLNKERAKGGLPPITLSEIFSEVKKHEHTSMVKQLTQLEAEKRDVAVHKDGEQVTIQGQTYLIDRLKYVIKEAGIEVIQFIPRMGRAKTVFVVNGPSGRR